MADTSPRTPGGNQTAKTPNEKRADKKLERKTGSSPIETRGQWRR
jgi:hypothetical protein